MKLLGTQDELTETVARCGVGCLGSDHCGDPRLKDTVRRQQGQEDASPLAKMC